MTNNSDENDEILTKSSSSVCHQQVQCRHLGYAVCHISSVNRQTLSILAKLPLLPTINCLAVVFLVGDEEVKSELSCCGMKTHQIC